MKTRRGSLLWSKTLGSAILTYKPGDVVKPITVLDQFFTGVVRSVDTKTNKITVAWGGGPESQHDADELMPMPFFDGDKHSGGGVPKAASCRRVKAEDVEDIVEDEEILSSIVASDSPFKSALRQAIEQKIKELKRDGTTGMSVENLKQVVRSPSFSLDGAPKGTNAKAVYAEMFEELCSETRFCRKATSGNEPSAQRTVNEELAKMASVSRRGTGEMSRFDIQPGGEYYSWAKDIEKAAREIQRLSKNKTRFLDVRPFDKYQGPYARMTDGKIWSGEREGQFVYDGIKTLSGTPGEIALALLTGFAASNLRSRRAMYWCGPDRTFRLTKQEQESGAAFCPRCKLDMNKERFTRSEKLYVCPSCGFKVPTGKTITHIEVKVPENVSVEVTHTNEQGEETSGENTPALVAASRRGKVAYADVDNLADLPRMSISEIATIVSRDWKSVFYGAKPYLEAMFSMNTIHDNYGMDSGKSVVAYFLSNATGWRGEVAKSVKKELNRRLK